MAKSKSKSKSKSNKKSSGSKKKTSKSKSGGSRETAAVKSSKSAKSDKKTKKETAPEKIKKCNEEEDGKGDAACVMVHELLELVCNLGEEEENRVKSEVYECFKEMSNDSNFVQSIEGYNEVISDVVDNIKSEFIPEKSIPSSDNHNMMSEIKNEFLGDGWSGLVTKKLQTEEVINCTCDYREEDGLMVQCDICLTWQHATCCGMNENSDIPENYICIFCMHPKNIRSTKRYSYANNFLTSTKLPKFSQRTCKEALIKHRESVLSKSFQLTANLRDLYRMERTLTAKISIAEEPGHPKLYMWSANWDSPQMNNTEPEICMNGPIGEKPIESVDCRLRLLDKIEAEQHDVASRLAFIQEQLRQLESGDNDRKGEEEHIKQAIYMFIRDLNTLATAVSLS